MKYIIPVEIVNLKSGTAHTVPFFADTQERADLLADILRTLKNSNMGGGIQSFERDNSALNITYVNKPAKVEI